MPRQLLRTVAADLWWRERLREWLDRGQIPADCVSDLRTSKNTLSVYEVQDATEAEQVVAAIALQRAIGSAKAKQEKSLDDQAGMLFDPEVLTRIGIRTQKTTGQTQDSIVNERHIDLIDLSGKQLVDLAHQLLVQTQPRTFFKAQLLESIRAGVEKGRISAAAIPARVSQQIGELQR